ncbi:glycosyltransferase family 2 protein [Candidatus Parcubacteria bacterium]|nr:glycosyltransferase family 2 protein [Candidatus Parcubacteria bacterium]
MQRYTDTDVFGIRRIIRYSRTVSMAISNIFLYTSLFTSLFFEIFLLITYFEIRDEIKFEKENNGKNVKHFPTVSIIVPCYNEEKTVLATIDSILALDYPADKLSLIVVDDGSKDRTREVLKQFENHKQIRIFAKENGGKHSALNFALERIDSELVGCLDADSFVDQAALLRIVPYFDNNSIMAVTPSIKIHEPKTVLQYVQKVEYSWGIFLRRMLSSMDALYVTPGPFSIFRTEVFRKLGGYRQAHHTEDMEMALRMQKHGYRIANSHNAHVYTVGPAKLKGLYKQRVRWAYGFLNNAIDYRDMYFNRKYGHIGMFILPMATISIFSTLYAAGNLIWSLLGKIPEQMAKYEAVGFNFGAPHFAFNWFSMNTGMTFWITMMTILLTFVILFLSLTLANGKAKLGKDVFYYLTLYIFIVPLWLGKAVYSTIARKDITWK